MVLGDFPGLVDVSDDRSMVNGEFVRLLELEKAIATLDAIEGFRGFGKSGSLDRRTIMGVDVGDPNHATIKDERFLDLAPDRYVSCNQRMRSSAITSSTSNVPRIESFTCWFERQKPSSENWEVFPR